MATSISLDRLRFVMNRMRSRLWMKPLVVCVLSVIAAFMAGLADGTSLARIVPNIAQDSIETLLSIMAASMLVIATFSVASMVAAYASAGSTATPRSFSVVVADDASQYALSTFVGAFIFSVVALTAVQNDYFEKAGLFTLFCLTLTVFGIVIMTFVRWVDRIARLGRMGSTIEKVEQATAAAMRRRKKRPTLGGVRLETEPRGRPVHATKVGYVQHIDTAALQSWAEQAHARVAVDSLPGTLAAPGRVLAYVSLESGGDEELDLAGIVGAFEIGNERMFDDDPRFGLIVLSEIAGRALSPAVNDPGTAIIIVGTLVRLFVLWNEPSANGNRNGNGNGNGNGDAPTYDRVSVPEISVRDMMDDAFTAIARDGAGVVEVAVRLQKAMSSLESLGDQEMRSAAEHHGRLALKRSSLAMSVEEDLAVARAASGATRGAAQITSASWPPAHERRARP